MDIKETIKKIAEDHQGYLKEELPVIKGLAYKILKVHYHDNKDELVAAHRQFGRIQNELELALVKKPMVLFPLIWDYARKPTGELLQEIRQVVEEVEIDNMLLLREFDGLRNVTNNYTMPEGGCPTYDTTYRKMEALEAETRKYIEIERKIYGELF